MTWHWRLLIDSTSLFSGGWDGSQSHSPWNQQVLIMQHVDSTPFPVFADFCPLLTAYQWFQIRNNIVPDWLLEMTMDFPGKSIMLSHFESCIPVVMYCNHMGSTDSRTKPFWFEFCPCCTSSLADFLSCGPETFDGMPLRPHDRRSLIKCIADSQERRFVFGIR